MVEAVLGERGLDSRMIVRIKINTVKTQRNKLDILKTTQPKWNKFER